MGCIKFSRLSDRWQEISEQFETRSMERGITQLRTPPYSEGLLAFPFLAGRSSQIQKLQKSRYSISESSFVQKLQQALILIL